MYIFIEFQDSHQTCSFSPTFLNYERIIFKEILESCVDVYCTMNEQLTYDNQELVCIMKIFCNKQIKKKK